MGYVLEVNDMGKKIHWFLLIGNSSRCFVRNIKVHKTIKKFMIGKIIYQRIATESIFTYKEN